MRRRDKKLFSDAEMVRRMQAQDKPGAGKRKKACKKKWLM